MEEGDTMVQIHTAEMENNKTNQETANEKDVTLQQNKLAEDMDALVISEVCETGLVAGSENSSSSKKHKFKKSHKKTKATQKIVKKKIVTISSALSTLKELRLCKCISDKEVFVRGKDSENILYDLVLPGEEKVAKKNNLVESKVAEIRYKTHMLWDNHSKTEIDIFSQKLEDETFDNTLQRVFPDIEFDEESESEEDESSGTEDYANDELSNKIINEATSKRYEKRNKNKINNKTKTGQTSKQPSNVVARNNKSHPKSGQKLWESKTVASKQSVEKQQTSAKAKQTSTSIAKDPAKNPRAETIKEQRPQQSNRKQNRNKSPLKSQKLTVPETSTDSHKVEFNKSGLKVTVTSHLPGEPEREENEPIKHAVPKSAPHDERRDRSTTKRTNHRDSRPYDRRDGGRSRGEGKASSSKQPSNDGSGSTNVDTEHRKKKEEPSVRKYIVSLNVNGDKFERNLKTLHKRVCIKFPEMKDTPFVEAKDWHIDLVTVDANDHEEIIKVLDNMKIEALRDIFVLDIEKRNGKGYTFLAEEDGCKNLHSKVSDALQNAGLHIHKENKYTPKICILETVAALSNPCLMYLSKSRWEFGVGHSTQLAITKRRVAGEQTTLEVVWKKELVERPNQSNSGTRKVEKQPPQKKSSNDAKPATKTKPEPVQEKKALEKHVICLTLVGDQVKASLEKLKHMMMRMFPEDAKEDMFVKPEDLHIQVATVLNDDHEKIAKAIETVEFGVLRERVFVLDVQAENGKLYTYIEREDECHQIRSAVMNALKTCDLKTEIENNFVPRICFLESSVIFSNKFLNAVNTKWAHWRFLEGFLSKVTVNKQHKQQGKVIDEVLWENELRKMLKKHPRSRNVSHTSHTDERNEQNRKHKMSDNENHTKHENKRRPIQQYNYDGQSLTFVNKERKQQRTNQNNTKQSINEKPKQIHSNAHHHNGHGNGDVQAPDCSRSESWSDMIDAERGDWHLEPSSFGDQSWDYTISKSLTSILRHNAYGYQIDKDGYIPVEDILSFHKFQTMGVTMPDILRVVQSNDKDRFHLQLMDGSEEKYKIRATQGHTVQLGNMDMEDISDPSQYPVLIHATNTHAWNMIKKSGVKSMGRDIHMITVEPKYHGMKVSGMRYGSNVFIHINMEKCLQGGIAFRRSSNNVILSRGNEDSLIPVQYFDKVHLLDYNNKLKQIYPDETEASAKSNDHHPAPH